MFAFLKGCWSSTPYGSEKGSTRLPPGHAQQVSKTKKKEKEKTKKKKKTKNLRVFSSKK